MLNTTEILIHIILEWKMKKILLLQTVEYKIRRVIKRKNKESIDEISQRLFIKQKQKKNCSRKNRKLFFQKQNQKKEKKNKSKGRN